MKNAPSRLLRLTSPHMRGDDVRRLQVALNARRAARNIAPITVDGEYGPETASATRSAALFLGAPSASIAKGATPGIQTIIIDPSRRNPVQIARAKKRQAATPVLIGPEAALAWGRTKIGVKEHPAGSNSGPQISDWQHAVNMGAGPWCGAFAAAVVRAGGGHTTERWRYTPWIVADAKTGTGGFSGWVRITSAQPGDLVLYDWDGDGVADHVGVLVSRDNKSRTMLVLEGNTAVGNDSNGGEVMLRTRNMDKTVLGGAQVRWS